jgi:ribokinase
MSLLVVGGATLDLVLPRVPRLPAWPRHAEFTAGNLVLLREPPIMTLGGNGANAAYVAARCGARVTLHTVLGDDPPGAWVRARLEDAGCRVCATPARTAVNVTAASARGARATFFHATPAPAPVGRWPAPAPSWLLVCGWPHPPLPAVARLCAAAKRRAARTALDAGPILGRPWPLVALRPVFAALDLLIVNEHELLRLTRSATPRAGLARIRRGFAGDVIVKRGAEGALWLPAGRAEPRRIAGRRVHARNTIGAGDTFNGALLAALDRGAAFPAALRFACATAASVVRSARGVLGVGPSRR